MSRFQLLRGRGLSFSFPECSRSGLVVLCLKLVFWECALSLSSSSAESAVTLVPALHVTTGLPFFFFSDRLMSKMRLRQVMIKVLIVWCMIFVVQLLLNLKSRRDLIFELKIHSLLLKLFLLNVWTFSSVTILRKHACWSGRLGLIPLSSFSVKLYLGLCRVPCPWRACKFTGFSRQPLGHHMLAGVSGSLFLQFLSLASQVRM